MRLALRAFNQSAFNPLSSIRLLEGMQRRWLKQQLLFLCRPAPPGSKYNPHFIYVDMDRFERNKPFFTLLVKEARCGNQVILHISIIA